MNTVVTGGAGFVGSHLTEELLRQGHRVTVLDNFSTGRHENLAHLQENTRLLVQDIDIAGDPLAGWFREADWVFHLAALADIVPSIVRPLDYHRANVDGTVAVVEAARQAGVKRLIYAASSSCYGRPDKFPTSESAEVRPQYPYALSKYLGEQIVLHWGHVYKLPVVSLRLFNVYGPRARTSGTYGAVFGVFLAQKLNGQPFTVVGDGAQTRDFTFVTDVVRAFVSAAESDLCQEIFNVGSGGTYSVNQLVELLGGPVAYIPKRPGEPECTFADISKIRMKLHWNPAISFKEGVGQMVARLEDWRSAPVWTPSLIAEATKEWFQYLSS